MITIDTKSKLEQIEAYIYNLFNHDSSGHDFYHMKRVAKMAKKIAKIENADSFIAEGAGWIHDVGDKKLFQDPTAARKDMREFLVKIELSESQIFLLEQAINNVSYSKGHRKPKSLEGQIVQDADRLDAIGAIGIARAFAYGGSKGSLLFSEIEAEKQTSTIQHFYDKLLLLKDLMNTETAKQIANQRQTMMESFLTQFYKEWEVDM